MLPIDQSSMPSLPVRKALVIIDFQGDFLDNGGPLLVSQPAGFVERTLELVKNFRKLGDIVWVCTEFERHRHLAVEPIVLGDDVQQGPTPTTSSGGQATRAEMVSQKAPDGDPEAFLSQGGASCARSPPGSAPPLKVKEACGKRDISFIKSHYSAFKSGQLLQLLRGKLVTKLYICGSLLNIGVHATATDAAMYGYDITIVGDCCGYRSKSRQSNALRTLVDTAGCEIVNSDAVMESSPVKVPVRAPVGAPTFKKSGGLEGPRTPPVAGRSRTNSPDLHEQLAALKLAGSSTPRNSLSHDSFATSNAGRPLDVDPAAQPALTDWKSREETASYATTRASADAAKKSSNAHAARASSTTDRALFQESQLKSSTSENGDWVTKLEPDSDFIEQPANAATPVSQHVAKTGYLATNTYCDGDTAAIHNVLPHDLAQDAFDRLRKEVRWQTMSHQGGEVPRLVAVQGEVENDGSMPVYRHPSDESLPLLPMSPAVLEIKIEVEKQLGHHLNHVLIQFYRHGNDFISEHSDKSLDIVQGSFIANLSLGAERTMMFRTKRQDKDKSSRGVSDATLEGNKRRVERAKLSHNSLCRMGLTTNMKWLHSIKQDKRMDKEKSSAELAYDGGRISLTFRRIGTFLDRDQKRIWGQGATAKTKEEARPVINGQSEEAVRMLQAFGTENHSSDFDWERYYGAGFDVLHMSNSPRLFYSSDSVVNMRIKLMLAEYGISYAKGSMSPSSCRADDDIVAKAAPGSLPIKFVDNDSARSVVSGDIAIMMYLDLVYGTIKTDAEQHSREEMARVATRFQEGLVLLDKWRAMGPSSESKSEEEVQTDIEAEEGVPGQTQRACKSLKRELAIWNSYASKAACIAGPRPSLADFAAWPVLHDVVQKFGVSVLSATQDLQRYYETFLSRETVVKVLVSGHSPGQRAHRGD